MPTKYNQEDAVCAKESKDILDNLEKSPQPLEEGNILFTYDVIFEFSEFTLASTWENHKTTRARVSWNTSEWNYSLRSINCCN